MASLRDTQRRFAASLFAESAHDHPRLAVYQRNLRGNFAKVLALEFPVVQRLVGTEYFDVLAWQFQQVEPSRSGNLHGIGAPFPNYLRGRFGGGDLSYLGDVADLEWAVEQSLVAADAQAPLDLHAFAAVPAEEHHNLRFDLQPSLRLSRSQFPIVTLWRSHLPDHEGVVHAERDDFTLDLRAGGENACIVRAAGDLQVAALDHAQFSWISAIAQRAPLGEALEQALNVDPQFDLGAALRRAVQEQWFSGLSLA